MRRTWTVTLILSFTLLSCAGAGAGFGGVGWLFGVLLLFASCTSGDKKPDAGTVADVGGVWESCCVDGVVEDCWCPANTACNYGAYDMCGDVCVYGGCPEPDVVESDVADTTTPDAAPDSTTPDSTTPDAAPDSTTPPDAVVVDATADTPSTTDAAIDVPTTVDAVGDSTDGGCDGFWEACCINGQVSSCCCWPENVSCNFGNFNNCDDGTCTNGDEQCFPADSSGIDAGSGTPDAGTPPMDAGSSGQ